MLAPAGSRAAIDDPDLEIAKLHFERGSHFYDAKNYRSALDEFIAAARVKAAPALDYNIARCYDRLEDYDQAIAHYQRYIAGGTAPDAAEVRTRIVALKRRQGEVKAAADRAAADRAAAEAAETARLTPDVHETSAVALIPPPIGLQEAPRRRHTGAIVGAVVAGVLVIGGAVALGVLFGQPNAPSPTKSDFGPWTSTR